MILAYAHAAHDSNTDNYDEKLAGGEALRALADGRADMTLISNGQPFREDTATVMPLIGSGGPIDATVLMNPHFREQ